MNKEKFVPGLLFTIVADPQKKVYHLEKRTNDNGKFYIHVLNHKDVFLVTSINDDGICASSYLLGQYVPIDIPWEEFRPIGHYQDLPTP